jgi:hypothetical protein
MDGATLLRLQGGSIYASDLAEIAAELLNTEFRARCASIGALFADTEEERGVQCLALARYLLAKINPPEDAVRRDLPYRSVSLAFVKKCRPVSMWRWEDHIRLDANIDNPLVSIDTYLFDILCAVEDLYRVPGKLVRRE